MLHLPLLSQWPRSGLLLSLFLPWPPFPHLLVLACAVSSGGAGRKGLIYLPGHHCCSLGQALPRQEQQPARAVVGLGRQVNPSQPVEAAACMEQCRVVEQTTSGIDLATMQTKPLDPSLARLKTPKSFMPVLKNFASFVLSNPRYSKVWNPTT